MRAYKDSKGRAIVTMDDGPGVGKGGEEIITTGNIEEVLRRKKAEPEAVEKEGENEVKE